MQEIKVWDPFVRIFHWTLVLAFTVSYLTGGEAMSIHLLSGYIIIGLLIFRIIWGFIGSKYARFSDFIYGPSQVFDYLKSLSSADKKRYIGHNPVGGWMIIALLLSLSATAGVGFVLSQSKNIPLDTPSLSHDISHLFSEDEHENKADDHDHETDEHENDEHEHSTLEEIHEFLANFTLFLVIIHIIGVFISSRIHGENLARAMVTGKKQAELD